MINNKYFFKDSKILVVGDLILDEYWFGVANRLSPEAPVPVVKISTIEYRLGAAGNVANNIQSLGGKSKILSTLGNNKEKMILLKLFKQKKILYEIFDNKKNNTITKVRVLANNTQIVRADIENNYEIKNSKLFLKRYLDNLKKYNVVVLSDYGKGSLSEIKKLILLAKKYKKIIIADPKGDDFRKYSGVDVLTPNYNEFINIVGFCKNQKILENKGKKLVLDLRLSSLLITQGKNGMTLITKDGLIRHINSLVEEVYDVSGAGDTVVSTIAICLAAKMSLLESMQIANIAASNVIKKIGTSTINIQELIRSISLTNNFSKKIVYDNKNINFLVQDLKEKNKTIVMTNGCFDIIHSGHINFLEKSKKMGDILIVAINNDNSVKKNKGPKRPINQLNERIAVLSAIKFIDYIISFKDKTPLNLYKKILPDILTKGGDYNKKNVVGAKEVINNGGKVKIIKLYKKFSTTSLINKSRKK